MIYGLVGKSLSHSFSKPIHEQLADYTYEILEMDETGFDAFMEKRAFAALNITIPYKQRVLPFCDVVDARAEAIGAVNTVVNREGRLYGYNTDFDGFAYLIDRHGISLAGKTVLILGNGGTTRTVRAVAQSKGAGEILITSRSEGEGVLSYAEAVARRDVQVIINASPVGMYPGNGQKSIDPAAFPKLEAAVDVIYNPLKTALLLAAGESGCTVAGGLEMLIAQAKYACEHFTGKAIDDGVIPAIYADMLKSRANVVLTGMPGCGKSSLGKALAQKRGLEYADMDNRIEELAGKSIPEIFADEGEAVFRDLESRVAAELGSRTGLVLATGGGAVLREENIRSLRQNGFLLFIDCPVEQLVLSDGRPLSKSREDLKRQRAARQTVYENSADSVIEYDACFEENMARLDAACDRWIKEQVTGLPGEDNE